MFLLTVASVAVLPWMGSVGSPHDTLFALRVSALTAALCLMFLLPLDMLMTRVFMTERDEEQRARLRLVIRFEALVWLLLLLSWLPVLSHISLMRF